jgi:hypothetical protein
MDRGITQEKSRLINWDVESPPKALLQSIHLSRLPIGVLPLEKYLNHLIDLSLHCE